MRRMEPDGRSSEVRQSATLGPMPGDARWRPRRVRHRRLRRRRGPGRGRSALPAAGAPRSPGPHRRLRHRRRPHPRPALADRPPPPRPCGADGHHGQGRRGVGGDGHRQPTRGPSSRCGLDEPDDRRGGRHPRRLHVPGPTTGHPRCCGAGAARHGRARARRARHRRRRVRALGHRRARPDRRRRGRGAPPGGAVEALNDFGRPGWSGAVPARRAPTTTSSGLRAGRAVGR